MAVGRNLNSISHLLVRGHPLSEQGDAETEVDIDVIVDPNIILASAFTVEASGVLHEGAKGFLSEVWYSDIMTEQFKGLIAWKEIRRGLDANDVNRHLRPLFGQYEDSFQDAWVEILERNPETINEVTPIVRKVRNRAIKQYFNKKYREESLHRPLGQNGDGSFTLESILEGPSTNEDADPMQEGSNDSNSLYKKIVDFLIGEYLRQKNENLELKRKEIDLKAERLRLRGESLKFKRDRFESWKQLMEEKGKQKEHLLRLKIQLRREELEFRKEQFLVRKRVF
jgi:hypothetical protein